MTTTAYLLIALAGLTGSLLGYRLARRTQAATRPRRDPSEALLDAFADLTLGDRTSALARLFTAADLDVLDPRPYIALGDLLRQAGHADRARFVHETLLARPGLEGRIETRCSLSLAEDFLALGRQRDAIRALQNALLYDPDNVAALRRLWRVFEEQENWKGALMMVTRIERATAAALAAPRAYLETQIGRAEAQRGYPREALRLYRRALKTFPACLPAVVEMGRVWLDRGKPAEAFISWRRFIREQPELGHLLLAEFARLRTAARDKDDPKLAAMLRELIDDVLRRLDRAAMAPGVRLAVAEALRELGRDEAVEPLLAPAADDPAIAPAYIHLLLEEGRREEALALCLRVYVEPRGAQVRCSACGRPTAIAERCEACGDWHTPFAAAATATDSSAPAAGP